MDEEIRRADVAYEDFRDLCEPDESTIAGLLHLIVHESRLNGRVE
jgi:hypothetical protein